MPVVILDLELSSLWSPATGIYVWGDGDEPNWDQRGEEWERQAAFRWFDRDGILRHIIREYLGSVDLVESFGDEPVELGGAGITIVILDV